MVVCDDIVHLCGIGVSVHTTVEENRGILLSNQSRHERETCRAGADDEDVCVKFCWHFESLTSWWVAMVVSQESSTAKVE